MTLLDLSQVTRVLSRLVPDYVAVRLEPGLAVTASADSPDLVASRAPRNAISIHLHHVAESTESRVAGGGGARVPVRTVPMRLRLRYLVTAHHADTTGEPMVASQHKLLGYALKTFHDHPVVDDTTAIGAGAMPLLAQLELAGQGNRFEIEVLRLDAAEAAAFFSGDARVAPPAVFVEVGGVELASEPVEHAALPVLAIGDHVLTGGAPHLARSRSVLSLTPPGASRAIRLECAPARVVLADPPLAPPLPPLPMEPDASRLFLEGSGLSGGERTLRLRGRRRSVSIALDRRAGVAEPLLQQAWRVRVTERAVELSVQRSAIDSDGGTVALMPGIYDASISIRSARPGPRGDDASVVRRSNVVPLAIVPRLVTATWIAPRRARLQLDGPYAARPATPDRDDVEIELAIAGEAIPDLRTVVARDASGAFPAPPADRSAYDREPDALVVWLREDGPLPAPGRPLAIQVVIDGAPGLPAWLEVGA